MTKMTPRETHLSTRFEKRTIIENIERFDALTKNFLEEKKYSNNQWVQTIYFNNNEHTNPFSLSLRARRYIPQAQEEIQITPSDIFFFEIKKEENFQKTKKRFECTLEEATKYVNELFPQEHPLRPYTLVQYKRNHYSPKKCEQIRITLDSDMNYFYFLNDALKTTYLGKEKQYRLEVKEEKKQNRHSKNIESILSELNAISTISKKFESYFLLNLYKTTLNPIAPKKELINMEIESKIGFDYGNPENIFSEIRNIFFKETQGFIIRPSYQHIHESASINQYKLTPENKLIKVLLKGGDCRIVTKGETEIVKVDGLEDCIIKRKEIKGPIISSWSDDIITSALVNELYRKRKAFWLENTKTHRVYHISLDKCVDSFGRTLHQLEIEGTGTAGIPQTNEQAVIDDTAKLSKFILENFKEVRPSIITKEEWLKHV
jgi:hypothetical protein